jgi:hypothetical protein
MQQDIAVGGPDRRRVVRLGFLFGKKGFGKGCSFFEEHAGSIYQLGLNSIKDAMAVPEDCMSF